jgi:hypothetical protein
MVGENEFRLCLVGGRRRFALSPPEHFHSVNAPEAGKTTYF